MTREQYISKFSKCVIDAVKGTPLFSSVMMAQAILESSDKNGIAGNSTLAKTYHNHFGIKADAGWKGKTVSLQTWEITKGEKVKVNALFRAYSHAAQSFSDRVKFVLENKRYTKHGVFSAQSPDKQAQALQRSGYATDPDYAKKLIRLIEKYDLHKLDSLSDKLTLNPLLSQL